MDLSLDKTGPNPIFNTVVVNVPYNTQCGFYRKTSHRGRVKSHSENSSQTDTRTGEDDLWAETKGI